MATGSRRDRHVFINVPFDRRYERLYIALIAGLAGLGLIPRSVLQIPASRLRLDRLFDLLQECGSSIHDFSRVQLDRRAPRTPRFNMPFEAGLAHALALLAQRGAPRASHPPHAAFVFEAREFRLQKSCSDLNGADPCVHNETVVGMLRAVTKAFQRQGSQRTVPELLRVYRKLGRFAARLKRTERAQDLYDGVLFNKLAYAAQAIAKRELQSP